MQTKRKITFSSELWILLVFFVLAGMNFKAKFFYFIFAALFVHVLIHKRIKIDRTFIWYGLFTVVYAAYSLNTGMLNVIRKFAFIGCYILSFNTTLSIKQTKQSKNTDSVKWLKACIVSLSTGAWLHLMLNFYINRGGSDTRNTIDIWTGSVMAATGQATLAVLMLATGIVLFLISTKKAEQLFGGFSVVSILLYNFILGGRTILFLGGIIGVVCLGFIVLNKRMPKIAKKKAIFMLLSAVICIAIIIAFDIGDVRTKMAETNLLERFIDAETGSGLLEDNRMDRKMSYLQHIFEYPFGGLHLREQYGYAHDLLLDAYDECGVLILASLIAILFNAIKDVIAFLKNTKIGYQIKCLVLCVYISFMIIFCLEPILTGMPWFFASFAIISGCVRGAVYTYG